MTANAVIQIITDTNEPNEVASPIGRSVVPKSFDIRYAPGILASTIADILCTNEIHDLPQAQKYPLKLK